MALRDVLAALVPQPVMPAVPPPMMAGGMGMQQPSFGMGFTQVAGGPEDEILGLGGINSPETGSVLGGEPALPVQQIMPDIDFQNQAAGRRVPSIPLRAYHGTQGSFRQFEDKPTWFSVNRDEALGYAQNRAGGAGQPRVVAADLQFANPATADDLEAVVGALGKRPEDYLSQADMLRDPAVVAELKERGHDGVTGLWDFGYRSDFDEIPVAVSLGSGPITIVEEP